MQPIVIRLSSEDRAKLNELADKMGQTASSCGIELSDDRALTTAFWCAAYAQPSPIPHIAEAVVRHAVEAEWDRAQKTLRGSKPIVVTFDEMIDELAVNIGFPATEQQIATVTERLRGASEESD